MLYSNFSPSDSFFFLAVCHFGFGYQHHRIFQLMLNCVSIAVPVIDIPLADGKLNVKRSAAERPLCHTQKFCDSRQEIKAVIALMLRYLITLYSILVRGEFCNNFINGLLENAIIVEQHTLFVEPPFERDTACGEGDAYQLSLVRIY